ncbi:MULTISPECIES: hypothetical protein [Ensifer]|uniref:hypothetical protein n=1 Tax=Ensifer TaxID=106591 RepID=UPI0013313ED2|nr:MULTISPECIES: hypothetical protein [Ensifer]MBD9538766.1 hypothetical protein [Ensifer sp. ENS04]
MLFSNSFEATWRTHIDAVRTFTMDRHFFVTAASIAAITSIVPIRQIAGSNYNH